MTPLDSLKQAFTRSSDGRSFDPVRNWLLLLALVLVAFVGILVWGVATFNRVVDGQTLGGSVQTNGAPKETFSFEDIESIFTSRAEEAQKYQSSTYTDPSL